MPKARNRRNCASPRDWFSGAVAFGASLVLTLVCLTTLSPHRLLFGSQVDEGLGKSTDWVFVASHVACKGGLEQKIGSIGKCGEICLSTKGCTGFGYSSDCAKTGLCVLRIGLCDLWPSPCFDQYVLNGSYHLASLSTKTSSRSPPRGSTVSAPAPPPTSSPSTVAIATAPPAREIQIPTVQAEENTPVAVLPDGWPILPSQDPASVQLPKGWGGPWDHEKDYLFSQKTKLGTNVSEKEATFGFYFPVYDNGQPAILKVIKSVRNFYPDSPLHVLQDGGRADFSRICQLPQYACTYEQVPPENSRWNPHSWMLRMHRVAKEILQTTFVIYLEPDVLVRGRHRHHPPHDAGGIYDNYNPRLHQTTIAYMQRLGRRANPCFRVVWRHFGLAGGSYFRTAAILDAFNGSNLRQIDWAGLFKVQGEPLFSSDIAMHVALSARGFTVYPWREAGQKWNGGQPDPKHFVASAKFAQQWPAFNPLAAFEHNNKGDYGVAIPATERKLLGSNKKIYPDLFCHGCVWYSGPNLETPVPVKKPQSWDLVPVPRTCDDEYLVRAELLKDEVLYPEVPALPSTCKEP